MRLVTFNPLDGPPRAGVLIDTAVIDLAAAAPLVIEDAEQTQWDMLSILRDDQDAVSLETAADIVAAVMQMVGGGTSFAEPTGGNGSHDSGMAGSLSLGGATMLLPLEQVRLFAPLPRPTSLRCFDTFEEHVAVIQRQRDMDVPAEWYRIPGFAFGNHGAVYGPDDDILVPHSDAIDYALQIACVVGREGRDIYPDEAADYIAGYLVLNDWAARDVEAEERPIGLGAVKAKDFATSMGPWLVTPDELDMYADDDGRMSLTMRALVNRVERSRGNAMRMHYTFADMIAHASRNATLYPGDVLASGTVGSGCLLDLTNGFGPWLEEGDIVELEITGLGTLRNTVV